MTNRVRRDIPQSHATTITWQARPFIFGLFASLLTALAILVSVALGWPLAASAVHDDGHFELDSNIVDGLAPGPDWGSIFDASGNTVNVDGGLAAGFLMDDISPASAVDHTVF